MHSCFDLLGILKKNVDQLNATQKHCTIEHDEHIYVLVGQSLKWAKKQLKQKKNTGFQMQGDLM